VSDAPRFNDLESRLLDLGASVEFPATPPLAAVVRARLGEAPPLSLRTRLWAAWRRPLLGAAIALAAAAVLVLAIPPARTTVAHWLGIRGVEITPVQTLPPIPSRTAAPPVIPGDGLSLGIALTLAQAQSRLGFSVLVPTQLGPPDAVWARDDDGGVVTLVYLPRPGLPGSSPSGVGLLVTEFRATAAPLIRKYIGPDTAVTPVQVGGGQGYWITGAPAAVAYTLPNGNIVGETLRLAGPTLVFEHGDLSVRIEGAPAQAQAVAIGESLS
jgi:hypothetical protein